MYFEWIDGTEKKKTMMIRGKWNQSFKQFDGQDEAIKKKKYTTTNTKRLNVNEWLKSVFSIN